MNYPHIVQSLYGAPWAATPSAWHTAHQVFTRHLDGKLHPRATAPKAERPDEDLMGEPMPKMEMIAGVAVIPIRGTLIFGAGMLEKSCGVVSHQDVHCDLDCALGQGVRGILLYFDCPGGTYLGTPELAARIADINKNEVPVHAWSDSLCASAAYWLASGCGEVYAAPSATFGSIGVIWETYSVLDQLREMGIEPTVFSSGPFKAAGHPWTALTDDQRAYFQAEVDKLAMQFKSHVLNYREGIDDAVMQGQVFTGLEAVERNLCDGLAPTREDALATFD